MPTGLNLDPVMRWIVGGHAVTKQAASTSQMGRVETEVLVIEENFAALAELSGQWIDRVHDRCPPKKIVLDPDSSVNPTHGDPEAWGMIPHIPLEREFHSPYWWESALTSVRKGDLVRTNSEG